MAQATGRQTHRPYISLACPSAYLRDSEVNAKGRIFVFQLAPQIINGLSKYIWAICYPANDADSTCADMVT